MCLIRSQELASIGLPGSDPALSLISAERLMYNHALELCQSAALDELFGNPHLVSVFFPKRTYGLHRDAKNGGGSKVMAHFAMANLRMWLKTFETLTLFFVVLVLPKVSNGVYYASLLIATGYVRGR